MEKSTAPVILDLAVGVRRLAGDRGFYGQIMQLFLSQAEMQLQAIQQAFDTRNAELVKRTAHSLKGAAANLGALRVQETAQELEAFGAADDLENARPLFEHLKHDLADLADFWQAEQGTTTE
jgi:HPt (histidine-containing phosphotransfer) domain-containing protein